MSQVIFRVPLDEFLLILVDRYAQTQKFFEGGLKKVSFLGGGGGPRHIFSKKMDFSRGVRTISQTTPRSVHFRNTCMCIKVFFYISRKLYSTVQYYCFYEAVWKLYVYVHLIISCRMVWLPLSNDKIPYAYIQSSHYVCTKYRKQGILGFIVETLK